MMIVTIGMFSMAQEFETVGICTSSSSSCNCSSSSSSCC
jgi:hypothetical protein